MSPATHLRLLRRFKKRHLQVTSRGRSDDVVMSAVTNASSAMLLARLSSDIMVVCCPGRGVVAGGCGDGTIWHENRNGPDRIGICCACNFAVDCIVG